MDIIQQIRQITLGMKETLVMKSTDPPVMMLDIECVEQYLDKLTVVLCAGGGPVVPEPQLEQPDNRPRIRNPTTGRMVLNTPANRRRIGQPVALLVTFTWSEDVDGEYKEVARQDVRLDLADYMDEYLA